MNTVITLKHAQKRIISLIHRSPLLRHIFKNAYFYIKSIPPPRSNAFPVQGQRPDGQREPWAAALTGKQGCADRLCHFSREKQGCADRLCLSTREKQGCADRLCHFSRENKCAQIDCAIFLEKKQVCADRLCYFSREKHWNYFFYRYFSGKMGFRSKKAIFLD